MLMTVMAASERAISNNTTTFVSRMAAPVQRRVRRAGEERATGQDFRDGVGSQGGAGALAAPARALYFETLLAIVLQGAPKCTNDLNLSFN